MSTKKNITKLFAVTGVLLLISTPSPVHAEDKVPATTGDLKIFEINMNDQDPLATLKAEVIEERAAYDAAINMSQVDMGASTITADTFDRTKCGLQNINIKVAVSKKDSDSDTEKYGFNESAAIRMVQPEGPQVILKSEVVTVDLGSTFNYSDNIGYVSNKDGKLPVIKETDNVDVNTEGSYVCDMTFIDASGQKSNLSYIVNVKKPAEVIRAEEEAAKKAEEEAAKKAAEEEAARKAAEEAARLQLLASMQLDVGTFTGSTSDLVNYAMQFVGSPYVFGGTTPSGFDCSGFTQYVFAHFGISLPRTSYEQEHVGTIVSVAEAQPGDLVTYDGHAGIYIGNGQIVNAMNPSQGVGVCSLYAISNGNMQIHRL